MELKIPAGLCFTRHKAATNVSASKFPQRAGSLHIYIYFKSLSAALADITKKPLNFRDRSPLDVSVKICGLLVMATSKRLKNEGLVVHQKADHYSRWINRLDRIFTISRYDDSDLNVTEQSAT